MLTDKRPDNNTYLRVDEYQLQLEALKKAKETLRVKGCKKMISDYQLLVCKYDILIISGTEQLIQPVNNESATVTHYTTNKDFFTVLHEAHLAVERDRMIKELKRKYCNANE